MTGKMKVLLHQPANVLRAVHTAGGGGLVHWLLQLQRRRERKADVEVFRSGFGFLPIAFNTIYRPSDEKNQEQNAQLLDHGSSEAFAGNPTTGLRGETIGVLLLDLAGKKRQPALFKEFSLILLDCYPIIVNTIQMSKHRLCRFPDFSHFLTLEQPSFLSLAFYE